MNRGFLALLLLGAVHAPAQPVIVTNTVPSLQRGVPYSVQFMAALGTPPYSWTLTPLTGTVPVLNFSSTGLWSGTVPSSGSGLQTGAIAVTVRDSTGTQVSKPFQIRTVDPLVITSAAILPPATEDNPYTAALNATGGYHEPLVPTPLYIWSQTNPLPAGCSSLASLGLAITNGLSTNQLTGTPPSSGSFTVCLTVRDGDDPAHTASAQFSLVVNNPPTLGGSFQIGAVNSYYLGGLVNKVSGGTAPFDFTIVSNSPPPGIVIVPPPPNAPSAPTKLEGLPTQQGTFNFILRVVDANQATTTKSYSITINPPILLTGPTTLPTGTVGAPYLHALQVTGGQPPYVFQLQSGSVLPAGLTLGPNGTISGTPTAVYDFGFLVVIVDAAGVLAPNATILPPGGLRLRINAAPAITTGVNLPTPTQTGAYSKTIEIAGGTSPFTWSIVNGALPGGLSLNPSTGLISGTVTSVGNYVMGIRAVDAAGAVAQKQFNGIVVPPPIIVTPPYPHFRVGTDVFRFPSVSGGAPPYTWALQGSLPAGLVLNPSTGVVSGTPTTPGTANFTFVLIDTNNVQASKPYSITIDPPFAILTAALPDGVINSPYSTTLVSSPSIGLTISWHRIGGALPPGLTLDQFTGVISGTPTTEGLFNFTILASETTNPSKAFSIRVGATPTPPSIQTTSLPGGVVNSSYPGATLDASGSSVPFTWSIQSGALPAGLTLDPATGVISGTPTVAGLANFTAKVTDSAAQTATKALAINVTASCELTLNPTSFTAGVQGATTVIQVQGVGCSWNATSSASFIAISEVTANSFRITIPVNPSPNARSGTVTVQGPVTRTLAVSQDGTLLQTGLRFVSLTPCRLVETRAEYNHQGRTGVFGPPFLAAGSTRSLPLTNSNVCQVPASAKAVVLNVTPIPKGTLDFMTLWPTGDTRPDVWSARAPDGQIVANSAIVKTGPNTSINMFTSNDTDLVLDISGYFTDDSAAPRIVFYPITPCRVIETRAEYRPQSGPFGPPSMASRETRRFRFPSTPFCSIPQGASAYSVGITVVPPGPLAFLTAWPGGRAQPDVSNINSFSGRVLANNVIIPAAADGSIDVFTFDRSDFLMDINGYFALDDGVSGMYYYPVTQCRASSTVGGAVLENESTRTIPMQSSGNCGSVPNSAKAYALTVTALPNGPMPFVTAYPTGQPRPNSSILNAFEGQLVTNSTIVPAGTGGSIDIFAFRRTNLVVDLSGYFGR